MSKLPSHKEVTRIEQAFMEVKESLINLKKLINKAEEKVNKKIDMNPANSYLAAGELNKKQIDTYFVAYPWMKYLRLVDGTIIDREAWQKSRKLEQHESKTKKTYNIT